MGKFEQYIIGHRPLSLYKIICSTLGILLLFL